MKRSHGSFEGFFKIVECNHESKNLLDLPGQFLLDHCTLIKTRTQFSKTEIGHDGQTTRSNHKIDQNTLLLRIGGCDDPLDTQCNRFVRNQKP